MIHRHAGSHSFEAMGILQLDLVRIRRWCDARVPKHLWEQVKVEADVADRHVAIVEVRTPWDGQGEHTRFPIAACATPNPPNSGHFTGVTVT